MALSDNIRSCRQKAGMSQIYLAELTGICQSAISRMELGAITPSVATLSSIASALNVDIDTLVHGER